MSDKETLQLLININSALNDMPLTRFCQGSPGQRKLSPKCLWSSSTSSASLDLSTDGTRSGGAFKPFSFYFPSLCIMLRSLDLYLVDGRLVFKAWLVEDGFNLGFVKVGDSNSLDQPSIHQIFHSL